MAAKENCRAKMREIFVPRAGDHEQQTLFISVNGKNYYVPCGKRSMVPDFVADEYERSVEAKNKFWETSDALRAHAM